MPHNGAIKNNIETKVCTKCLQELSVLNFRKRTKKYTIKATGEQKECEYYEPTCCSCVELAQENHRSTATYRAWKRDYRKRKKAEDPIKFHMQERISTWRRKDSNSDLTVDYLISLYKSQQGKCYYSGEEMILGGTVETRWSSASLDRLNPDLGYKQGNLVWCTYKVNTMKGALDYDSFLTLLRKVVNSCSSY